MKQSYYRTQYYALIEYRKENPLPKDAYGEKHHIKPRSIYPDLVNDKNNIVKLTAAEHFKCHYYLVKMYEEEGNIFAYKKMLFAFNNMSRVLKGTYIADDEIEDLSKLYRELREAYIKADSGVGNPMYGKHLSEDHKRKIGLASKRQVGIKHPMYGKHLSEDHKKKLSERNKGKKHSKEHVLKVAESNRGKKRTEEQKQRMREAWILRKQKKEQLQVF